ncbi:MAG TPA: serine hydrolase [Gemmatimonadaceae bacterium]|nr:serine hydrolase [Gemmatimonadaceae bacterium]
MLRVILTALTVTRAGDGLPVKPPTDVGMSSTRLEAIERVVARGIKAGGYPGAAVVVGRNGAAVMEKGFGRLSWVTTSAAVDAQQTIYDVASLTKVVGTTAAVMILFDEKKIDLDERVVSYIPTFTGGEKSQVTLRQLLTHTSGLPAGRDIWRITRTPLEARAAVVASSLETRPGSRYIYSDLGADLLGLVVEVVSGEPLDKFLERRVFAPLGMTDTFYRPADSLRYRIAPTEVTPPRGYPLRGEVHDENAYALGGVAGHAGLFSTAADLSVFAQMMLNGGEYNGVQIISRPTVELFTSRAVGHRALGWDTAEGDYGSGRYLGPKAYGHTGFTGTSMWIDPERQMFVILLTNRVHAARALRPAKVISDVRADLSDAAVLAVLDGPQIAGGKRVFRADREVGWNPAPRRISKRRHASSRRRPTIARTSKSRVSSAKKKASSSKPTRVKKPVKKKTSKS